MFGFKKKVCEDIFAPVNGFVFDIEKVGDGIFSNKILGDGIAISPTSDVICAPCDGIITMVASTKHAFGIKMDNDTELMVHIGLETVNLEGKYFEQLISEDCKVKHGDPIIKINSKKIIDAGYELTTMLIITVNDSLNNYKFIHQNSDVNTDTILIQKEDI